MAQLFSIFNNYKYFCIKENKESECIICGKKIIEEIDNMQPFIFVNEIIKIIPVFLIYYYQNIKKFIVMIAIVGKIKMKMYFV